VVVAENNGEVVGCNHWLPRNLKLSSSLKVKAMLAADIAVRADYQRNGVGKSLMLFLRSSGDLKEKKASIICMFANPKLSKSFHTPTGRYVPAPDKTVSYYKVLMNWKKLREHIDFLNEVKYEALKKSKVKLRVLFKISGDSLLWL